MGILKNIQTHITKKTKASSLTEVLVATTLILLVFAIAIATLNNILTSITKHSTTTIETELNELQYQYLNNNLNFPFYTENDEWQIEATTHTENNHNFILFEATNKLSKKKYSKKIIAIENN